MEMTLDEHDYGIDDEQSIEHRHLLAEQEISNERDCRYAYHSNKRTISTAHEIEYGYREKEKE